MRGLDEGFDDGSEWIGFLKWAWSSRSSLTGVCSRRSWQSWNGLSIDPRISTWSWTICHRTGSWIGSRHCEVDLDVDVPKMQVGG